LNRPELILPPTRHLGTALSAGFAAVIVLIFAVALLADPMVEASLRPGIIALGLLFGGTLGLLAWSLARGHGALWLDKDGRRLGLGVTGLDDVWWVPLSRVAGLRMVAMPSQGTTIERWMLLILISPEASGESAPPLTIVLAESDARGTLDGIGTRLGERLGLPYGEGRDDLELAPARGNELRYAVRRGAALGLVLVAFGVSLLTFGILAVGQLENEPVVGFIFAPIMMVMGLALTMVSLVKRLATEHLSSDGTSFTHAFTFGRWRWGERTIRATRPRFRLRLLGMRGALLELVGDDGTLVLAAGATSRSSMTLEEVSRLPARFLSPET
jgi:hypothetical protein